MGKGKVILAGAGPGDPELITVKALRYLQQADVVITDRLVSDELLAHRRPDALLVQAGKQCGKIASVSQADINEMIVTYAQEDRLVLRLKGGDVAFFSNVLDELRTLVKHGIPFEIVPGVTAASGASAYAGIPLTAREHATSVRLFTFHKADAIHDLAWKELAATDDTLVFYMTTAAIERLTKNLLEHAISDDKRVAIIEQATTPQQRVRTYTVRELASCYQHEQYTTPALIIVGKVVQLHEAFQWYTNTDSGEQYFKNLD